MPAKKKTNRKKTSAKKAAPKRPSALRQLSGAVIGGTLALGIYYAYDFGAPLLTAWIALPGYNSEMPSEGSFAQKSIKPEEQRRIESRARNIISEFGASSEPVPEGTPVPDGWDLDALTDEEVKPSALDDGWDDAWDDSWDDTWDEAEGSDTEVWQQWNSGDAIADAGAADDWDTTWDDAYFGEEMAATSRLTNEYMGTANMQVRETTKAPELPSSGTEMWLAALILAGAVLGRRYDLLHARALQTDQ